MKLNFFQLRSLATRLTLFTLVIFLLSLWSLTLYISHMLRQDMQRILGEQQLQTASFVAADVNASLKERLSALEQVASKINPSMLGDTQAIQARLEDRPIFQSFFNGGTFVTRLDGTVTASVFAVEGRSGVNYSERDYLLTALKDGKSVIGRPRVSETRKTPFFVMAVPIRNDQDQVIGALAGVTHLADPNFLDNITQGHHGKTGGYVLAAPQHQLNVTASNRNRIMATLPPPGVNPMMDRYAQGYEGTTIFTNPLGVEVLASVKQVPVAGWYLAATLPVEEAFAPISTLQQRMLLAALVLTLLAAGLTWWMVRRQLSPLLSTIQTLATRSPDNRLTQALPITRQDEIGDLITGFNRLLLTLGQREESLTESQALLRQERDLNQRYLDSTMLLLVELNKIGQITMINRAAESLLGFANNELLGRNWFEACLSQPQGMTEVFPVFCQIMAGEVTFLDEFENSVQCRDGSLRQVLWRNTYRRDVNGQIIGTLSSGIDITERQQAQADLRIAAVAFESQEAMLVTDANKVILRVNRAFTQITGYTADEVIGQTPRLLSSGRHDASFYRTMWADIRQHGGWQGEVWDRRKDGSIYPKWLTISVVKNEAGTVTNYVGTHYDITDRKLAEEKINELAYFDQLTGLPNRTLLLDRLKQAATAGNRTENCGAVLLLDLDNFKNLNDTQGHDKGDQLLQQVAGRLTASVREGDTVARLGGDEFVVVLAGLNDNPHEAATAAKEVGEKILAALSQTYQLGANDYRCSASIGATLFRGHETSIDDLLKQADLAMYKSKETGRNALHFFDPVMQQVVLARSTLEKSLRTAIAENQFVLHYQAQVAASGQVTGAEVLVRWLHPGRGMVSPAEFIPLAEETGLILQLGHWVLETACQQLARWAKQPELAHLTVAVNVSAHQFREADFVTRVKAVLADTGVNPKRLKLELTESLLVNNVQSIIAQMTALKVCGVGFSLDDFGTGYSSLAYLKRMPLDQLKIDQSFVRDVETDPNDAAIARTIVALAQSLCLGVIAEGVETQAQRNFLSDAGCNDYQGYFFSRPLPLADFEAFAKQAMPA